MNLSDVRTTLRDRVISLQYEELASAFDTNNLPETVVDKTFHIGVLGGKAKPISMDDLILDNDVEIVVWRRGFREAASAIDAALMAICEIASSLLAVDFRTKPAYRNIQMEGYKLEPIADDNDNTVKATMTFTVQVSMAVTADIT